MKRLFSLLLTVLLVLLLAGCSSSDTVFLTLCTPPSSSGMYAVYAVIPDAVRSDYSHYNISIMEGSGSPLQVQRVREGAAQFCGSTSSTDYESYYGTGAFEGHPDDRTRTLFYRQVAPLILCVSKSSGIETFADLDGKRFCPGMTGSAIIPWVQELAAFDGIGVEWMPASMGDAIDAYSDRQVAGVAKASSGNMDSSAIQLNAAQEIRILSLTDEEIAHLCELNPYLSEYTIPAGSYDFIDYDVHTIAIWASCGSSSQLSQEDGYHIVKSLIEGKGKDLRLAAAPGEAGEDYVQNTLAANVPIHAGMVQYMEEVGVEVPQELIPLEYVPVQ